MAASFNCPHCDAVYPTLPTLYGRTVRCSTCKQPFRLRGDGVAEKVDAENRPKTKKVERTDQEKEELTKAFITKSKKDQQDQKPATRRLQRRNKSLKDLKQSMSTALSAAANEAIAVEETKRSGVEKKPAGTPVSDKNKTISAVLTDQGAREHKIYKKIIIFFVLIVVGIYFAISFISQRTPQHDALVSFIQPTNLIDQPRKRAHAYLKRTWLMSYDRGQHPSIILNIDEAEIEEPSTYELTIPGTIIQDKLSNLIDHPELCMWIEPSAVDSVTKLWGEYDKTPPIENFYKTLDKTKIRYYTYNQLLNDFKAKEIPSEITLMFSLFLSGTTDEKNRNKWSEKLLSGDVPHHCIVAKFAGTDGRELVVNGNSATYRKLGSYDGILLKFAGSHWDENWRIFTVQESSKRVNNPLFGRHKKFLHETFKHYNARNELEQ